MVWTVYLETKIKILRWLYRIIGRTPATQEMVQYWKHGESMEVKVTTHKRWSEDGSLKMIVPGEKYPISGFPRGHLLNGKLSKLKHEIKNQIFNESWAILEKGEDVVQKIKDTLPNIFELLEDSRYDMVPPTKMSPSVRELHRAWTKSAKGEVSYRLRDCITYILQEDDAYRFRFQWMILFWGEGSWWGFGDPVKRLEYALTWLENAEVIDDMKERIRLFRRVIIAFLNDKAVKEKFLALCKECDWKKVRMGKAEAYHFRGKYFKVDLQKFEY